MSLIQLLMPSHVQLILVSNATFHISIIVDPTYLFISLRFDKQHWSLAADKENQKRYLGEM